MKNKYLNIMKNKLNILQSKQNGFTLIEILVVVALMGIILSIVVFQLSDTRRGVYVENTAEGIVLALRKAQSLALAVHSTDPLVARYNNGYGVHFAKPGSGMPLDSGPVFYTIFTDFEVFVGGKGWDRAYSYGGGNVCTPQLGVTECVEKIEISSGDVIDKLQICSTGGGSVSCSDVSNLAITFLRPSLDATFCTTTSGSGGCPAGSTMNDLAKITVKSPTNVTKVVTVWSTGHISIE